MLGVQHMLPAWAVGAGLFFLAVVAYLAYSVLAPDVLQQIEKNRLDRYFRYNMVRSFAYYSNRHVTWGGHNLSLPIKCPIPSHHVLLPQIRGYFELRRHTQ